MDKIYQDLLAHFPTIFIKKNYPLAPLTTLKIGGPADIFVKVISTPQLLKLLKYLSKISHLKLPITILGNGSNVLISDLGIRGIVIQNTGNQIKILSRSSKLSSFSQTYTQRMENEPDKYLDFTKIDYDESNFPQVKVQISSGTPLPYAINYLLDQGITGLQWFAYIPGTIGGAIVHNAHGGSYHLSDYLINVKVFNLKTGKTTIFPKSKLPWQYEKSYFLDHPNMVIISANFSLFLGDVERAKNSYKAWLTQKSKVQPMNSAGCVFANPPLNICQKIWGEQKSTGWIIDHELNLKGFSIGGAQVCQTHANFIINTGHASAKDYLALIKHIQNLVKSKFGFTLSPEIKLLGSI